MNSRKFKKEISEAFHTNDKNIIMKKYEEYFLYGAEEFYTQYGHLHPRWKDFGDKCEEYHILMENECVSCGKKNV